MARPTYLTNDYHEHTKDNQKKRSAGAYRNWDHCPDCRSRYDDEVEKHRTHTNKDDSEQFMGKDEMRNQENSSVS